MSVLMAAAFGFISLEVASSPRFVAWLLGQLTVMQLHNPEFLRGFGVGVLNARAGRKRGYSTHRHADGLVG